MAKFHISVGGPAPCNAEIRDCPIGGAHFDDYPSANKEFQARLSSEFGGSFVRKVSLVDQSDLYPIDENTVGAPIVDESHMRWIADNSNEFQSGEQTPYLEPEHSVYFKRVDDYYTKVVVLGEDSIPLMATSFDILADRDAAVEKLAFMARMYELKSSLESTKDAEALYSAFKAEGGTKDDDPVLIHNVYRWAIFNDDNIAGYFERYAATDNSERARRAGKKNNNPSPEARVKAVKIATRALNHWRKS